MKGERNIMDAPIVPKRLTGKMVEFCETIGKPGAAVYIPFYPEDGIKIYDCMGAVKQKIMRDGGRACYGWVIWQWANMILEAVAYIMWKGDDGRLIDVTPEKGDYESVLFIPDPGLDSLEEMGRRIPITNSVLVKELLEITDKCENVMRENTCRTPADVERMREIILPYKKRKDEILRIISRPADRNETCPCGSGMKYKKCCGYF